MEEGYDFKEEREEYEFGIAVALNVARGAFDLAGEVFHISMIDERGEAA